MLDAKKQAHTDQENTIYSIHMHQNFPFFMKKRQKMAAFWSKIEFSGFRQAIENPPPYFEGAGCKRAGSGERQITKTQFTAYIFHEKAAKNGRFWSKIEFFGLRKAFEDPPPLFRGCWMRKSRFWADTDHENTIYSMRMHQHLSFFMTKNGQEWPFLVKD